MPINKIVYGSTTLIDLTDTTAVASDVAVGKYFYAIDGTKTEGTASGGGGSVSITDEANATGITCVITTSSEPTPSSDIPLNTELIDYWSVVNGYYIEGTTGELGANEGACCSDFTKIDPSMTFSFVGYRWFDLAFYDSTKTYISGGMQDNYRVSLDGDYAQGTLSSLQIPSNAEYIRLTSYPPISTSDPSSMAVMSLIRIA